jgi:hypothetical protein
MSKEKEDEDTSGTVNMDFDALLQEITDIFNDINWDAVAKDDDQEHKS